MSTLPSPISAFHAISTPILPESPRGLDALWNNLGTLTNRLSHRTAHYLSRAKLVLDRESRFAPLSNTDLRAHALKLREAFRRARDTPADLLDALAIIREAAHRTLNQRPYLVQVAGALAITDGCIAEMATGEGKTLTATLPATIAGWRGHGCHVVTVNDYLAKRDAQWMTALYEFLHLSVACVESTSTPDQRRAAYAADITYSTNKELAADFLRDRLVLAHTRTAPAALARSLTDSQHARLPSLTHTVMRGLHTAIVDEADSVLIDEAVTPLIIAGPAPNAEAIDAYAFAARIAATFEKNTHYRVDERIREITLTPHGRATLNTLPPPIPVIMHGHRRREELIVQALVARELHILGKHYVIEDGKVAIVDEFTGRLMPDRTWRDGIHQAVEAKESLEINPPTETLARLSFQRFFRMYRRLSGMTGTARELRAELWRTYALPVVTIPTGKPCIRTLAPDDVLPTESAKWDRALELITAAHARGQPVLVGCRTVHASEHLSALLSAHHIPHALLNARRAAEEAAIVERAGEKAAVTIATNMAGRGTDIRLAHAVREVGGLFVLATERHESRRIDRQLFGRAGRQGDPGHAHTLVSLDDELLLRHSLPARLLAKFARTRALPSPILTLIMRPIIPLAQRAAQRTARAQRRSVLLTDDWLEESLGFAGRAP